MTIRILGSVASSAKQYRRRESAGSPPAFLSAPVILGTPQVGVPVSFLSGTITGSPAPTVAQQWLIDGLNVSGATNLTYTPQASDAGKLLSVRQTASNANGTANSTSGAVSVQLAPSSLTPTQVNLPLSSYFQVTPWSTDLMTQGQGIVVPTTTTSVAANPNDGWPRVGTFEPITQEIEATTAPGSITWEIHGEMNSGATVAQRAQQTGDVLGTPVWNPTTKKLTVTVSYIAGRPKAKFHLVVTNGQRLDGTPGCNGIRCARNGYTLAQLDTTPFTSDFLGALSKVRVIRYMNWNQANTIDNLTQGLDWEKRPKRTNTRTTASYCEDPTGAVAKLNNYPYEYCIDLANATGKDMWLCLPINATNAYVTSLIALLQSTLNPGIKVYIEISNEMWNFSDGYQQFDTLIRKVCEDLNGYADTSARSSGTNTRHIVSATRSAGIVTLTLSQPHTYVANGTNKLRGYGFDGIGGNTVPTFVISGTPAPNQVSFARAGADGPVAISGSSWIYDDNTTSNLVANASPFLYDARIIWITRRLKEISEVIRGVVGDSLMRTRYVPVYAYQSAGTEFQRELSWLKATFPAQDPGYYIMACAHASYFGLNGTTVGLPRNLASDTDTTLVVDDYVTYMVATAKFAKKEWGYEDKLGTCLHFSTDANPIELLTYEAGPDTSSLGGSLPNGHVNNTKKSQANFAPGFQPAMFQFYSDQMRFGSNGSMPSQYLFGVTDPNSSFTVDRWETHPFGGLGVQTWPKIAALNQVADTARPVMPRNRGLGTFDARLRSGSYEDITPDLLTAGAFPWLIQADFTSFNTQCIQLIWEEDSLTPRTLVFRLVYTCNFGGWLTHIDINGTRVAASAALTPGDTSPNPPVTERTLGPFTFTSRPGKNGIRLVRAGGGAGRDGQLRRWSVLAS